MCTVSFIRTNEKVIITSNRDEQVVRQSAIEPRNYAINGKQIIFPKDPKAGGTWFVVDEFSNVIVLLNGANEKHVIKESYRKSRGLIVLDLISANSSLEFWKKINLENIEPFTIVLFENQKLYQLQWNEIVKSTLKMDDNQAHIWSSATLYSEEIRKKRANWFNDFLFENATIDENSMMAFHQNTKSENTENGLVINRNNFLKTLSCTQVVLQENKIDIHYTDLQLEKEFSTTFSKA